MYVRAGGDARRPVREPVCRRERFLIAAMQRLPLSSVRRQRPASQSAGHVLHLFERNSRSSKVEQVSSQPQRVCVYCLER